MGLAAGSWRLASAARSAFAWPTREGLLAVRDSRFAIRDPGSGIRRIQDLRIQGSVIQDQ